MRATTQDGQTVILRKNGNWFFYNTATGAGQSNTVQDQGTTAATANGQIVILEKNGTWIMTKSYQNPSKQNSVTQYTRAQGPTTQNSNVASLAESGHWEAKVPGNPSSNA